MYAKPVDYLMQKSLEVLSINQYKRTASRNCKTFAVYPLDLAPADFHPFGFI